MSGAQLSWGRAEQPDGRVGQLEQVRNEVKTLITYCNGVSERLTLKKGQHPLFQCRVRWISTDGFTVEGALNQRVQQF